MPWSCTLCARAVPYTEEADYSVLLSFSTVKMGSPVVF